VDADERRRLTDHFTLGFRELQLRDLQRSDAADIRMGTFIQAAAFIDALALAYSAFEKVPGGDAGKWGRFVERYFPPEYAPVAAAYVDFRCLLLHNFSAGQSLGFTHNERDRHLEVEGDRLVLDRGSFVAAVTRAFDAFEQDVFADDDLGQRVLRWLDKRPPLGFWVPPLLGAGMAAVNALTGTSLADSENLGAPSSQRSPDRPRSQPKMAPSIKQKPKKRNSGR
jgi:hypothetical protein